VGERGGADASSHPPPPRSDRLDRFLRFLRAHPILCLAILTPGIPEYLSTSSPVLNLVANPFWFFLGLAINVGQYTAGALLVREALLRWKKGWATLVLLALAYGITEEGLGDNTLFNSNQGAEGVLGSFGRFAGVNWVWSTGVLAFHVIYSIGLPIVLLGLALPATKGRSLVGRRGLTVAFTTLTMSTALELAIVLGSFHFWMGWPLFFGCLGAIAVLVFAAYRLPGNFARPATDLPRLRPWGAGVIGFSVFPILFFLEYYVSALAVPAVAIIATEALFLAFLCELLRRRVGRSRNEYVVVNLAFGFILWQCVFGLLLTLGVPYTLPLVLVAVWFFVRLRRAYPAPGGQPSVTSGPAGA